MERIKSNKGAVSNPILYLKEASIAFGSKQVFDEVEFVIYEKDRIALIGRNGEGKSTLLKILAGIYTLDSGQFWTLPNLRIGYLPQDFDHTDKELTALDYLEEMLYMDEEGGEEKRYQIDIIAEPLGIQLDRKLRFCSGGELRRVYLAGALLNKPDLLLLDEPTNHLDIATIEWLENYIEGYPKSVICISHDRAFLSKVSKRMLYIDRGMFFTCNKGYEHFEKWNEELLEQENKELERLRRQLTEEEHWKLHGVTARRKRNQRRLSDLRELRSKVSAAKEHKKKLAQSIEGIEYADIKRTKLLLELEHINYSIADRQLIKDFSLIVAKKEKIGIIGPNGSGKSTLLNIMLGKLKPDSGKVWISKHIDYTFCDQMRSKLDPELTLWETMCPNGGDQVLVGGRSMHVVGYLKRFMFDPKIVRDRVSTLSGGQANRLLLAMALANPGSLLILDEPTNDLDVDTLDMLQELLWEFAGTVIVVSHDRDFLDRIVTKTLIFEGDGKIVEYYGSYVDYRTAVKPKAKPVTAPKKEAKPVEKPSDASQVSYKIRWEYEQLPIKIEALENEIKELEFQLSDDGLYSKNHSLFTDLSSQLSSKNDELERLWARFLELSEIV